MKKFLYGTILAIAIIGIINLWHSEKNNMRGYSFEPKRVLATVGNTGEGTGSEDPVEDDIIVGDEDEVVITSTNETVSYTSEDTIQLLLTGHDENLSKEDSTDLTLPANASKIKITVGGSEVTPKTKSVSTTISGDDTILYYLTLIGVGGNGQLSVILDEGILKDKRGNQSAKTTINTEAEIAGGEKLLFANGTFQNGFTGFEVNYDDDEKCEISNSKLSFSGESGSYVTTPYGNNLYGYFVTKDTLDFSSISKLNINIASPIEVDGSRLGSINSINRVVNKINRVASLNRLRFGPAAS